MDPVLITIIALQCLVICVVLALLVKVSRLEGKLNSIMRPTGIDRMGQLPLSDQVKAIADDPRRKLEAIKAYREETGVGLMEAKQAIEAYIDGRTK